MVAVLGQAAIAQLLMAEQVLDDVERVLDPGPHLRRRPLNRLRQTRGLLGKALMMPRLIAMFQDTSRSSSSGRLSAPV